MARILVAASSMVLRQVSTALSGHEILETTTLRQAERLVLQDGIDIFVIGIQFDESRAVDLVKSIRLDPKHKATPIVMVRLTPSNMADSIRQTMNAMTSILSINVYLELEDDQLAAQKIRDIVATFLPSREKLLSEKAQRN